MVNFFENRCGEYTSSNDELAALADNLFQSGTPAPSEIVRPSEDDKSVPTVTEQPSSHDSDGSESDVPMLTLIKKSNDLLQGRR